ncbi:magnesium transporter NIPA2 [Tribolium castaneum]|uniref:Magnesium transporter NIPA2-like Protein n=1 Tax=Tribolium castaneum TaxID=7070 RepID=D6X0E4_TRICA|nr:PREDICTED: magnesium transporter NIPA2 [Tribolium castaneum]EFA09585.1 Magnesium transporter NIPA2-like Protein [Tribolium castaneum]|eukprot:XP_969575.1 PREDICTED: magnesium transporter NIPA2 [Tribolium castaneum]
MESSTKAWSQAGKNTQLSFYSGLGLAILSSVFIGSSFIIKKLSLLRLSRKGALRAGAGGFGYLKDWMWWLGFLTMGIGELANFAAYTVAPASLVTPLGALSVLVSAVLASKFLKETLNTLGKLGCLLCILGSIVLIIHSPKEQEVASVAELVSKLHNTYFLNYIITVVSITIIIIFYVGPRYGSRHVMVYITLCSSVGSLTVMACKGLGLSISEIVSKPSDLSYWSSSLFFLTVAVCIFIQMNYLNKALDLFNTSVVTPVYYVMFTSLVIVASAILFNEWGNMTFEDILGSICGFLTVIVAIFMLQGYRKDNYQKQSLLRSDYTSVFYT